MFDSWFWDQEKASSAEAWHSVDVGYSWATCHRGCARLMEDTKLSIEQAGEVMSEELIARERLQNCNSHHNSLRKSLFKGNFGLRNSNKGQFLGLHRHLEGGHSRDSTKYLGELASGVWIWWQQVHLPSLRHILHRAEVCPELPTFPPAFMSIEGDFK